jgi:KDO2-lipid IV(A) lauroyltransferase
MKKDSAADYLGYLLVRVLGAVLRILPLGLVFCLGRGLGALLYYFDLKHKALAYANIKAALGGNLTPRELNRITRSFYRNFGQSIIETFLIPLFDKRYFDKHIELQGSEHIEEAYKIGKGVIFAVVHEDSWEISNLAGVHLGYPFNILVAEQSRYPRLNNLLNSYRRGKQTKLIRREGQSRGLIEALKKGEIIALTCDQGGKSGELVNFFGRGASMSTGAVKLALKYQAAILPIFSRRLRGARHVFIIEPPLEIKDTGRAQEDVRENLGRLMAIFEKQIRAYPEEYLWTYKVWKYGQQRNILILSDAKAGHLRQAQAVAGLLAASLREKGIESQVETVEVKFRNNFTRAALALSSCLAGRYHCQGCSWCLKSFLEPPVYQRLCALKPDFIISCGAAVAPVNHVLSRENLSKSIVIMRPPFLSTGRFDLVIMPCHDRPPKRKNVLAVEGALNLIDEEYLKAQTETLSVKCQVSSVKSKAFIGLLLGGDSKSFHLDRNKVAEVIRQVKQAAISLNAEILVTTSRRTSKEIEAVAKEELAGYPHCKLLVIANEKNIPQAVGGILGLSKVVVVSPESISMISEAASSNKRVLVFNLPGLSRKHGNFLARLSGKNYISLVKPQALAAALEKLWRENALAQALNDRLLVKEALEKII